MKWMHVFIALCLAAMLAATAAAAEEVVLMTHDSFNADEALIKAFEKENGIKLKILKSGDAGIALNQAILSKNNPLADVFFGVDNTFMGRALKADIFVEYKSPLLADIDDALELDPGCRLLPVDYGDVCLNYDIDWFAKKKMDPPKDLAELVDPRYKSLTVVENPATSSPGLAFLLATVGRFGQDGYIDFWKKLAANDLAVSNGWEDAYWGSFSGGLASRGDRPIVVSYASSPPVEVLYADPPVQEAPTAAVVEPKTAFRQIEFVGILQNAAHPEAARKLVDFLLSQKFQEDIPLKMFMFPTNSTAALPELFVKHARVAKDPVVLPPDLVIEKREAWIQAWTEAVLR